MLSRGPGVAALLFAILLLAVVTEKLARITHNQDQRRRASGVIGDPKTIRSKTKIRSDPVEFRAETVELVNDLLWVILKHRHSSLLQAIDVAHSVSKFDLSVLVVGDSLGHHIYTMLAQAVARKGRGGVFPLKQNSTLILQEKGRSSVGYLKVYCQPRLIRARDPSFLSDTKKGVACGIPRLDVWKIQQRMPQFDVLVYRIPHPHLGDSNLERDFRHETGLTFNQINESISLLYQLFGTSTVILTTIPYNNNVWGRDGYFHRDNDVIRDFIRSYQPLHDGTGIRNVLLLEWEGYTNELILESARLMGLSPDQAFQVKLSNSWHSLAAMICPSLGGVTPVHMAPSCGTEGSKVNPPLVGDGMHWVGRYIRDRTNAGLLCLMQCAFATIDLTFRSLHECQDECNARFMTLRPIDNANTLPVK